MVLERFQTCDPNGNVDEPFPPRPAECVGDDHCAATEPFPQTLGRGVRIRGQNQCEVVAARIRLQQLYANPNQEIL